jgi:hypothetical protein
MGAILSRLSRLATRKPERAAGRRILSSPSPYPGKPSKVSVQMPRPDSRMVYAPPQPSYPATIGQELTSTASENAEVFSSGSVAVAVRNWPTGTSGLKSTWKLA